MLECNGNAFTKLMHSLVFNELQKMRIQGNEEIISSIVPEKTVIIEKNGVERQGRFDFFVRAGGRNIGIEVLTRPSQGKMRKKLAYAKEVDEFIFALPNEALGLYRKKQMNGFKRIAPKKFLGKEFADPKLRVWMLDCKNRAVQEKGFFPEIFEVR